MKYPVIATDYDGTLATEGKVDGPTLAALERYRDRGGNLLLVTGRQLDDLLNVFPHSHLFEGIVAENGAVFYHPQRQQQRLLAQPFPPIFMETLIAQGVDPITQGQVVVATWEPHGETVQRTIQKLNLAATVIFNKRAVMVLPEGVNKATGLAVALTELGAAPHQVAGIGDAENDRSLLETCGLAVAVANALPALKAIANYTTTAPRGAGVQELIDHLLNHTL
jgi:hydroxymethylpyrimidine pyrophosphatase-like HAD family hydrolase